jgi:hypothetical protein
MKHIELIKNVKITGPYCAATSTCRPALYMLVVQLHLLAVRPLQLDVTAHLHDSPCTTLVHCVQPLLLAVSHLFSFEFQRDRIQVCF